MADGISLVASVISLTELSMQTLRYFRGFRDVSGVLSSTDMLEYEIHCKILSEVGGQSILGELPDAAQTGLTLCSERIKQMGAFITKRHYRHKEVKRAIKDFGKSVEILRDIVMDATTHRLLQDQHHQFSGLLAQVSTQINDLKIYSQPSDKSRDPAYQRHQEGLKDIAEQLQANVERYTSRDRSWRQEFHDPFSFEAAIIHPHSQDSGRTFVHTKLDTGCEDDWIALEILERASMDNQVNELDVLITYVAFGGQTFEPLGTIDVTWYPTNSGKSRQTRFLVHREVPFDVVLGRRWIREEGWSFFERPVMALKMGKFSKEEHRIIEENARKKGATKSQISDIRRANDSTTRDRLRQEKAASLAATPAFSSSRNRSIISPSASQLYSPSKPLGQDTDASSLWMSEESQPAPHEEAVEADRNT